MKPTPSAQQVIDRLDVERPKRVPVEGRDEHDAGELVAAPLCEHRRI